MAEGVFPCMETKQGMSVLGWATSGSVKVSDHFFSSAFPSLSTLKT